MLARARERCWIEIQFSRDRVNEVALVHRSLGVGGSCAVAERVQRACRAVALWAKAGLFIAACDGYV
jgi:hypothetical protein